VILVYKKLYALAVGTEDTTHRKLPYAVALLGGWAEDDGIEVTKDMADALEEEIKKETEGPGLLYTSS
jgi:hypothetical protein